MVRSPSCDNVGMKKGPWTPEEDIALVSYIQEHGQGNWRLIPARSGLLRSSKSCRLRWTNYLRPGIKHGNFTAYEDRIIIHLQALLGNRWAAISSYLPQRTDNDIKNYWNTHLKKTLSKLQTQFVGNSLTGNSMRQSSLSSDYYRLSKEQWETKLQTDMNHAKSALFEAINMQQGPSSSLQDSGITSESLCMQRTPNSSYAITLEYVSKLLEGWKKSSPKETKPPSMRNLVEEKQCQSSQHSAELPILSCGSEIEGLHDADNGSLAWPASVNCSPDYCDGGGSLDDVVFCQMDSYPNKSMDSDLPFSVLEEWLLQ